jgi:hypothetical protein
MGHKKNSDSGEYEFTRAAYDELRDAEVAMEVKFVLSLEPTAQRGVWALSVVGVSNDGSDGLAYIAKWQGSWPNSIAVSYGAFLFTACHRCVRMVEAWYQCKRIEERPDSPRG